MIDNAHQVSHPREMFRSELPRKFRMMAGLIRDRMTHGICIDARGQTLRNGGSGVRDFSKSARNFAIDSPMIIL